MVITNPETKKRRSEKQGEKVRRWRIKTKTLIIQSMGGECQICGYKKCHKALELHHIDPTQKEKHFSDMIGRPTKISSWFEELKKAVLLCANCHREVHDDVTELPNQYQVFDQMLFEKLDSEWYQ